MQPDPHEAAGNNVVAAETTLRVKKAVDGDTSSLAWIVERLAPLLLAQAEYRLGPALRREIDPLELVHDAWAITLPKIGDLNERDGRITPVLLSYLTTTMTYRVGRILRKKSSRAEESGGGDRVGELTSGLTGVTARIARKEVRNRVWEAIQEMQPADREVLILRGLEQHPSKVVAEMIDVSPPAVDQRYARALKRLREQFPRSVFDELLDV